MKSTVLVLLCVFVFVSGDWLQDVYNFGKITAAKKKQELLEKLPKKFLSQRAKNLSEIVETELGLVQGIIASTFRDKTNFAAYLAIPYGAPPVGDLRFKAPVPAEPWQGVLNATTEGTMCYGVLPGVRSGEDCLNLNIFSPVLNPSNNTELRAVLVFIYGGAFLLGSDEVVIYGPDHLLEKDVVVVTLNYRLGALGFLSLQNEEVPGNAGLKDQLLALKFVKNNIVKFGGDPNRIVVFGESAGAGSTSYLQLTKAAEGLFNGIILESGTVLCKWAKTDPDLSLLHAQNLGNIVNCTDTAVDDLLACLREAPAKLLSVQGELAMTSEELDSLNVFVFEPTIEPDVEGALITKDPFAILESGDFIDVDVIVGMNSQEGMIVLPFLELLDPEGNFTESICNDLTRFFPNDLTPGMNQAYSEEIAQKMSEFYFNGTSVTLSKRKEFLTLVTDMFFTTGVQRYALLVAQKSKANVYNYHFVYEGPFNMLKLLFLAQDTPGVCHADEIGYLFTNFLLEELEYNNYARNSTPHITIDRFTTLWTNFAKTGNPTPTTDDTVITTTWSPLTTTQHNYLEISEQLNVKQGLDGERQKFWNDAYELAQGIRPFPE